MSTHRGIAPPAAVDGHDLISGYLDGRLVYNDLPVGICRIECEGEGQSSGPCGDDVVGAEVGKLDQKLLVLIDSARVVRNDH